MKQEVLLDAGPLVALVNPRDQFHHWVRTQWAEVAMLLLTCEAVISEACFLLQQVHRGEEAIMTLIQSKVIAVPFHFDEQVDSIKELLVRYQSVPMSFADACMVRLSELYPNSLVMTLDSDFNIYRKDKTHIIPVMMPGIRGYE
jgi:uncharacterized protein